MVLKFISYYFIRTFWDINGGSTRKVLWLTNPTLGLLYLPVIMGKKVGRNCVAMSVV